jgi:hypothetical protein
MQVELNLLHIPPNQAARSQEILDAAQGLIKDMIEQEKVPVAATLGAKGGAQTAKRGSEYFRQLAAKRKTRAGGRPRKES